MSPVQQYWLPGYGLSRHIVLGHIQYFLGPSATVRPYSYQGREGYLINGVPLTRVCSPIFIKHELKPEKEKENQTLHITNCSGQEQIDDLAVMSREYEKQEATRMAHNSSGVSTSSSSSDNSVTQSEPYINEIIPISQPGARRREPDSRGGR
ncbi:hypothetical protein N7519_011180 [Penicillium mononematosum]|uniref:uncharacterized protein n=1 Tax=Penicillium mononematosum TaxID=268346 RepID=UPI00254896E8|nr:uncharacterized protein N7519_011180 [Penicillium mononematosum]KAJ6180719.1 hypothetical protein N7519_011180 [Penicillium mononematosum]